MLRTLLTFAFVLLTGVSANAQEQPRAILVLDASGSMWGQIDGVAKITIAQEVIGGLLQTLPEDQLLGLTVYGARRKGDCSDIETLVAPTSDRGTIAQLVNRIKPRGKTPMTDAVIAAAETLKYTEEAATVILISDGKETCNPDPCQAARVLEENGVDFTAHVIGFNVSDENALAQMQCLAEETGGIFRTASNADELAQALQEVAEPEPVEITLRATEGEGGPEITEGLIWSLSHDEQGVIFENEPAPDLTQIMGEGTGRVEVMRLADETYAEQTFTVGTEDMVVTLVLPPVAESASLDFTSPAPAGGKLRIAWDGPGGDGDYIALAEPGMRVTQQVTYAYTARSTDGVLEVDLPTTPGTYEVRYIQKGNPRKVLASAPLVVEPVTASLDFTSPAPAGGKLEVIWEGPGGDIDFIAIAEPGETPNRYATYKYTKNSEGNVLEIEMPTTPGTYELRYVQNGKPDRILAAEPISVVPVTASLDFTSPAPAGGKLEVTWEGPGGDIDFIAIAEPGETPNRYATYKYTRNSEGNALEIEIPTTPGTYELRYVQNGKPDKILAAEPISVVPLTASLDAPDSVAAGQAFDVAWTGPGYPRDRIIIAAPGSDQVESFASPTSGAVVTLYAPTSPGEYELR
ncbi:MAG TPA: VWA domain-containing protein, partial [Aliiroseovarius sp.]|nr:VWA domain-containing protein [Aliiroseovarius sp.]